MNITRFTLVAGVAVLALGVTARVDTALRPIKLPSSTACDAPDMWHPWDDSNSTLSDPYPLVGDYPGSVDLLVWQGDRGGVPVCT